MSIAVVICTLGRADAVRELLAELSPQGPAEIVVIDQSGDNSLEAATVAAGGRWVAQAPSLPRARNRGIAETKAPIVVFLDDDVRPSSSLLAAHQAAYTDPTVGAVAGRIVERHEAPNRPKGPINSLGWDGRIRVNLDASKPGEVHTVKGANMSFRRLALEQAGGFDPELGGTAFGEDADASLAVRALGWRIVFAPHAAVEHLSLPTGGTRNHDAVRSRFENTGYLVAKHRRAGAQLAAGIAFAGVAASAGLRGGASASASLFAAFLTGLRRGRRR